MILSDFCDILKDNSPSPKNEVPCENQKLIFEANSRIVQNKHQV